MWRRLRSAALRTARLNIRERASWETTSWRHLQVAGGKPFAAIAMRMSILTSTSMLRPADQSDAHVRVQHEADSPDVAQLSLHEAHANG